MTHISEFCILDADLPEERQKWEQLWLDWPSREIFAHPAYVLLFCRPGDRALCAVSHSANGGVLFPLILHQLKSEPWVETDCVYTDLESPYGYGGPFARGEVDVAKFWSLFSQWAAEKKAVSCFLRFSLFREERLPFNGQFKERGYNVVRDLTIATEAIWMDYEHKVRKNVNRASRSGLKVIEDRDAAYLDDFISIYYNTMARRSAKEAYLFSKVFFEMLVKTLPGQYCFFHVIREEKIVSTELILISEHNLYSFLGGTLSDAFKDRPNDLLKHEIILWGQKERKRSFVLGGGANPMDGIFRYKKSFAPSGIVAFTTGHMVFDYQRYEDLIEKRRNWEKNHGREWQPKNEFFPEYRD